MPDVAHPIGSLDVAVVLVDADLAVPSHAKPGDAGLDLCARDAIRLAPGGGRALVATGVRLAIPDGYAGLVLPRSGLAARHGITVLNAPGLIDSGYRGEILVPLINTDPTEPFEIQRGERIAQLVVVAVPNVELQLVEELPPSVGGEHARGFGGFGHTGR